MGEEEKLLIVRAMVGDAESDNLLLTYLMIAGRKILARAFPYDCRQKDVPAQYDYLQCEIAAYLLNKRGAEGQTSHSENSITRNYESADVPASMLNAITPHCGIPK